MKQFVEQWSSIAKRAAQSNILERLTAAYAPLVAAPLQIPQTGIASWNLYYFCPDHGVRLTWDSGSPHQHRCPVDGHIFSGEPYDSAWWREMNGRNASTCNQLGLLWRLTGDEQYAHKVRDVLLGYADVYPGYAVHGNIPHNGPGKMNAQTLCEANCLLDMALGYDFIAETLSPGQQQHISDNLLRCGATFLREHRSAQMHNHEVKINAALAVLGFILNDEDLLEFAVFQPYGLRWQLEQGLLAEGLWFEGSIHYHYYALQGFIAFEKLARGTRWSLLDGPWYRKMLDFPLTLLWPDGTFPRLNDCLAGQEKLHHRDIYEFAWAVWRDPLYAAVLRHTDNDDDDGIDRLLWREEALPEATITFIPQDSTYAPGAGLTLWRRPDTQQAVLIKHTPYGGEHDHYDRLSLLIWHRGNLLLPDLGTTGYGAQLHYDYYKNSATHNTLTVNQTNQPPSRVEVLSWHQGNTFNWLDCEVDWRQPPPTLNSHTRVEWDSHAWQDIRFRRRLLWLGDTLIDLSDIENPHQQQLDWTLHLAATPLDQSGSPGVFSIDGPLRQMRGATMTPLHGCQPRHFLHQTDTIALWLNGEAELWQGYAPDNPATTDLSYLVLRSHQPQARLVCVWDFSSDTPITDVMVRRDKNTIQLTLCRAGVTTRIVFDNDVGILPDIHA